MYIRKRVTGTFQVQVRMKGQFYSATFNSRRECEVWGKDIEKKLKTVSTNTKSMNVKLKDFMEMYKKDFVPNMKTAYEEKNKINHLLREYKWLVNLTLIEAMEVSVCLRFRKERIKEGNVALNKSLCFFNVLFQKIRNIYEYPLEKNPLTYIEKAKTNTYGRLRVITRQEYKCILSNDPKLGHQERLMYKAYYLLNRHCGIRPFGEALRIKWSQLDDINDRIYIGDSKTNSGRRSMPIPKFLINILLKHKKNTNSDFIFNRTKSGMEKNFQALCKLYEIDDLQPYDLRRNYCRSLVLKGYGIKDIAKAMGHSFVTANKMVELYSGFTWERTRHKIVN